MIIGIALYVCFDKDLNDANDNNIRSYDFN